MQKEEDLDNFNEWKKKQKIPALRHSQPQARPNSDTQNSLVTSESEQL